jgi:chlorophyll/bacteriochlorophyll a synthase
MCNAARVHCCRPSAVAPLQANKEESDGAVRQLLGLKGASASDDIFKIRLQLMKPVTWIPLIWGVICGAAASGNYHTWNPFAGEAAVRLEDAGSDLAKALVCMVLAGPFLTGYTQTINDWYDRDIDAINEPYRPIPSGAISEGQVKAQIAFLLVGGLALAYGLDAWAGHETPTVFLLSVLGSFISYIYSAPPLKLKQNGWIGNYALGSSYISLPWWCGQVRLLLLHYAVLLCTVVLGVFCDALSARSIVQNAVELCCLKWFQNLVRFLQLSIRHAHELAAL